MLSASWIVVVLSSRWLLEPAAAEVVAVAAAPVAARRMWNVGEGLPVLQRLLVPDRYLLKSAKWVSQLTLLTASQPGFWESHGYHHKGDLWKEERYENGPRW